MILELIKIVAILLALSLLQGFVIRFRRTNKVIEQGLTGLLFGGICVVGMMLPVEIIPGVIFDPRSVILSMAGLFGGFAIAAISAIIAGGYRIWIGGGGVYVGVAVVVTCTALGLLYRYGHQKGWVKIGPLQLLLFGLIVHVVEVLLFTQLPAEVVDRVMNTVALPLILTFTPATVFLGMLLIDIENRFKTEHALKESEAKLSRHLQNTPLASLSIDKNFICTQWNKAAETIFGYTAEEVLDRDLSKVMIPDHEKEEVMEILEMLMAQTGGTRSINDNKTKDGRTIICEWYNTPIVDEQGRAIGISSLCEDITAQEAIRREQQILSTELEARNAELERFVYTVSHDLRTPLISIKGFVGLIQKYIVAKDTEKINSDMVKINNAADTMGELLSGLLELSRIGRVINPPEFGLLTSLVKKASENVQDMIRERGVDLKIEGNMPTYCGDQLRLLEVFQNLIENAVKFMGDQPSPRIEISAALNGEMIVCKVKDNGIGIDPVYHDRIFNLFERLDPKIDGTGIGMALVKRIIEAHGGAITVESNGNQQGSSFIFTLPGKPFDDGNSQNSVTVQ
jgi:PAS domain S-box-containing protein